MVPIPALGVEASLSLATCLGEGLAQPKTEYERHPLTLNSLNFKLALGALT